MYFIRGLHDPEKAMSILAYLVFTPSTDHHPKCAELISINVPHEDPERAVENYGVKVDHKKATLNSKPNKFRLIDKGLTGDKGVVSFESLDKPNHYLRHKNYRFRLEKFRNTSVYGT